MNTQLTVALVQQQLAESREANLELSMDGIREAHAEGAELVLDGRNPVVDVTISFFSYRILSILVNLHR